MNQVLIVHSEENGHLTIMLKETVTISCSDVLLIGFAFATRWGNTYSNL